jgi:hypothetical protein
VEAALGSFSVEAEVGVEAALDSDGGEVALGSSDMGRRQAHGGTGVKVALGSSGMEVVLDSDGGEVASRRAWI